MKFVKSGIASNTCYEVHFLKIKSMFLNGLTVRKQENIFVLISDYQWNGQNCLNIENCTFFCVKMLMTSKCNNFP